MKTVWWLKVKSKRQDGGNEGHNLGQSSLPLLVISFPVPSSFQSELSLGQSGNSRSLLPPPPCAEPGGRGRHSLPGHPTPGPATPGPATPAPSRRPRAMGGSGRGRWGPCVTASLGPCRAPVLEQPRRARTSRTPARPSRSGAGAERDQRCSGNSRPPFPLGWAGTGGPGTAAASRTSTPGEGRLTLS